MTRREITPPETPGHLARRCPPGNAILSATRRTARNGPQSAILYNRVRVPPPYPRRV